MTRIILIFSLLCSFTVSAKNIYGLYEHVQLNDLGHTIIKAKLDTGARTSSLGATDIEYFMKDGEEWVRFRPQVKNSHVDVIEKPIHRTSKIKVRADDTDDDKSHTERPVVLMDLCINGRIELIEVNLADRSGFNYPLLIGSKALIELNAMVDPSLKFTITKKCNFEK